MPNVMTSLSRREYVRGGTVGGIGLTVGLTGCLSAPTDEETTKTPDEPSTATVEVGPNQNFVFEPGTEDPLTVTADTTVTFVWKSDGHNIVVGSQPKDANWQGTPGATSDLYDTGYSHEHTFDVPGDYHYWCQPHKSVGMVGDIVVEAGE